MEWGATPEFCTIVRLQLGMAHIRWIYLVIDVPVESVHAATPFWSRVSGSTPVPSSDGPSGHVTLAPPSGSPWLQINATDAEFPGAHLHLIVDDADAAAAEAGRLGARELGGTGGSRQLRSPAGVLFCLSPPSPDLDGVQDRDQDVLVDQACIDVPSLQFDDEVHFWRELTGWPEQSSHYPEFSALVRPREIPVRLTFQRVGAPRAGVHPDLACRRSTIVQREHEKLGAVVDHRRPGWTVMVAPAGMRYCVTDRDPATGLF